MLSFLMGNGYLLINKGGEPFFFSCTLYTSIMAYSRKQRVTYVRRTHIQNPQIKRGSVLGYKSKIRVTKVARFRVWGKVEGGNFSLTENYWKLNRFGLCERSARCQFTNPFGVNEIMKRAHLLSPEPVYVYYGTLETFATYIYIYDF